METEDHNRFRNNYISQNIYRPRDSAQSQKVARNEKGGISYKDNGDSNGHLNRDITTPAFEKTTESDVHHEDHYHHDGLTSINLDIPHGLDNSLTMISNAQSK